MIKRINMGLFENYPDLQDFEDMLQRLACQEADVHIAIKKGELSAEAGAIKLAELAKLNVEARQGPIYERWNAVYREAVACALGKPESK
ncbi:hypothetical protein KKB64_05500 [Patescibacteria group bacterium]|nr:hypothetical protein [Patescibacteria group bacterium]MBU1473206.1 hypothetical protein [Patescibacteria group bacterium]MBU2459744.1 hypothetical protein [Patescibacteria group bacterium]MBU2544747.1 hypothetical protein [Patescibacteria group bacterium]